MASRKAGWRAGGRGGRGSLAAAVRVDLPSLWQVCRGSVCRGGGGVECCEAADQRLLADPKGTVLV